MTQRIQPLRHDYSVPLRVGATHRQADLAGYAAHVAQMIRQVLLTGPGERVCMPEFGCGLRQLVFQPKTSGLSSTTEATPPESPGPITTRMGTWTFS